MIADFEGGAYFAKWLSDYTNNIGCLRGQRAQADKIEAEVFREIRTREHQDCVRAGRDNCL